MTTTTYTNPNSPFHWSFVEHGDLSKTFSSAIKYNNGYFKSAKQANFIVNQKSPVIDHRTDTQSLKDFFNVEINEGQFAIGLDGYMAWADYGVQGNRPVTWYYVLDEIGIVRKYKLKYMGTMREGTCPDPTKTKLEWSRDDSMSVPEWATPEGRAAQLAADTAAAEEKAAKFAAMKFLGNENEVLTNLELTLVKIVDMGEGDWGWQWLSIMKTADGDLVYWNNRPYNHTVGCYNEEGDTIQIKRARVKRQITNKEGAPAVVITRPTFKK